MALRPRCHRPLKTTMHHQAVTTAAYHHCRLWWRVSPTSTVQHAEKVHQVQNWLSLGDNTLSDSIDKQYVGSDPTSSNIQILYTMNYWASENTRDVVISYLTASSGQDDGPLSILTTQASMSQKIGKPAFYGGCQASSLGNSRKMDE